MALAELARAEAISGPAFGEGLDDTRRPLGRARHLPGYVYSAPEIFQLEKEKIFMKDWLCVARVEELETPGDFMTFDIMGDPIVITRDEDGALNAFSNLCRHRGVEVANGCGNTTEFSCPYHGWLYDLKGRLTGAPYMKEAEGFDAKTCRLQPLRIDVWAGWVFVNFDVEANPLADFVAEFDKAFAFLKQENCRSVERLEFEFECNWKFVAENQVDIYHAGTVHAETFGSYIDPEEFPFEIKDDGSIVTFYDAAPFTFSGKPLFGKMPPIADKPESFAAVGFLPPNMHMFVRCENFRPVIHWPLSPTRTKLIYFSIFPTEFLDRPDFQSGVEEYHRYYAQVVAEDTVMIESLQRAQKATMFEPGPMSKLEKGIHNIINHYLNRVFGD